MRLIAENRIIQRPFTQDRHNPENGDMELTYNHKGRPERPTVNEGAFVKALTQGHAT